MIEFADYAGLAYNAFALVPFVRLREGHPKPQRTHENGGGGPKTSEKKTISAEVDGIENLHTFVFESCLTLRTAPQSAEMRTVAKSLPAPA